MLKSALPGLGERERGTWYMREGPGGRGKITEVEETQAPFLVKRKHLRVRLTESYVRKRKKYCYYR